MKKRTMAAILAGGMLLLAGCADMGAQRATAPAQEARAAIPTRAEALAVIDKVNGYWQRTTPATE
jgi:PBP1b-binding outer membrane lipoprotein LpoB